MNTDRQKLVTVFGTSIMIGRDPQNTLVFDEPGIQLFHACLHNEKGTWVLQNLAEPETVTVDSHPVTAEKVTSGSVIHIAGAATNIAFKFLTNGFFIQIGTAVPVNHVDR